MFLWLDCKCNNVGSVTLQCDLENGECACKDGFIGEKCDACAKSTWSFERNCKGCIENHFNFNNDTECEGNWILCTVKTLIRAAQ